MKGGREGGEGGREEGEEGRRGKDERGEGRERELPSGLARRARKPTWTSGVCSQHL